MLSPGITISTFTGSLHVTGYVSGTEVELWAVAVEEWRVTATFFFRQYVHRTLEVFVWFHATWFANNHTTLDLLFVDTAEQQTGVVTSFTAIKQFAEHFHTCDT
jgi:hypothetical protein